MVETMTSPVATNINPEPNDRASISPPAPPCPCGRPMDFTIEQTWRCLACNPIPLDAPICATQKCKKPLTRLGDPWNCWICLRCNDHPEVVNKKVKEDEQRKRTYLDKKLTEEDVSEMIKKEMAGVKDMIRDAMSEFTNVPAEGPDYPPTHAEISQIAESVKPNAVPVEETIPEEPEPETYLQKAKRLGIPTHRPDGRGMLKKEDVLVSIAAKELEAGKTAPGDNDEFARGLTEEDMM